MTDTPGGAGTPDGPDAPRRTIEPLSPPAGRFDAVMGAAKARRYRRATAVCSVAGVFLAGLFGGLAMGGVSGVTATISDAAHFSGIVGTTSPSSPSSGSKAASVVPKTSTSGHTPSSAPTAVVSTQPAIGPHKPRVRGRVVDPSGQPVAQLFVYTETPSQGGYVPSAAPAAVTRANGRYDVACTGGPVLITPWQINTSTGSTVFARWAATQVTDPVCSRTAAPQVTRLSPAGELTGTVHTDAGCPDQSFQMWVWIGGNRPTSVWLTDLREGHDFRVSGLGSGQVVLGDHGRHTTVVLSGGSTTHDVTFACAVPSTTPTPTDSGTPTPTPTGTVTPPSSPAPTTSSPTSTTTGGAQGH
jgi:hypothetical protein